MKYLPLLVFLSAQLWAACICQCTVFKTSGGSLRLCEKEPNIETKFQCMEWRYIVPDVSNPGKCKKMDRKFTPCAGYYQGRSFTKKWIYSSDGQWHNCEFN